MFIVIALAFVLSIGYMAIDVSMNKVKENPMYQGQISFLKTNYTLKEIEEKKQLEDALKTTCEFVKTYAEQNGCKKTKTSLIFIPKGRNKIDGWYFLGKGNKKKKSFNKGKISFNKLNKLPKSNTLTCSTLDEYARYQLFNSISHLNYSKYSIKIDNTNSPTDECNIKDFVFIQ